MGWLNKTSAVHKGEVVVAKFKGGHASIQVVRDGRRIATLRAVREQDAQDVADWRHQNRAWFLTAFPYSPESTRNWIRVLREQPDRLLCIIDLPGSGSIGHVGLCNIDLESETAEVDSVLRGRSVTAGPPGLMRASLEALLGWAHERLALSSFRLRVFADNPAVTFYAAMGFQADGRPIPMQLVRDGERAHWEPFDGGQRYLTAMTLEMRPGPRKGCSFLC